MGVSDYLDDLVARIDAPLLDNFYITFFHQLILDTPQLTLFISLTVTLTPKVKAYDEITVNLSDQRVWVATIEGKLRWQSHADSQTGSFRSSAWFSPPQWNAFTSLKDKIFDRLGKTISRVANGLEFYTQSAL